MKEAAGEMNALKLAAAEKESENSARKIKSDIAAVESQSKCQAKG